MSTDPKKAQIQRANVKRGANLRHGVHSTVVMKPLRTEAEDSAQARWPWLDPTRLHLVADLAARVKPVSDWCDTHDIVHARGVRAVQAHPIVNDADRWQNRLDQMIRQLDAEQRERSTIDRHQALQAHLEANYRSDGDDDAP